VDEALISFSPSGGWLDARRPCARREDGGVDPGREAKVLRLAGERARKAGLPEEPVRDVYWRIVALCTPKHDT
jgi:hypothetical protein